MVNFGQKFIAIAAVASAALSVASARGFLPAVNYAVGDHPVSAVVADFNGDGKPDLAVANQNDDTVSVLFGSGDGTFQHAHNFAAGGHPAAIAAADFNGDGRPDLVVADSSRNRLSILLNKGHGFDPPRHILSGGIGPVSVAALDLNGDGIIDVAAVNISTLDPTRSGVSVLLGNGDGTFQAAVLYPAGLAPDSVAAGDFNGDGKIDLAVADFGGGVSLLLGNGDGSFQGATNFDSDNFLGFVAVGDFNGDGVLDLVVSELNRDISVMLGNGDGTFQNPVDYAVGLSPTSIAIGDFNGNGNLDLAVSGASEQGIGKVKILLGNGNGIFGIKWHIEVGLDPTSVVAADFNRDHAPDLVTTNFEGTTVSVLMNSGGTLVSDVSSSNPSQFGQPVTFTATVTPSFPSVGTPTGLINFYDGATLLAKVPLDNTGQASFTTSGLTVGTHSIRTHYSGDSNFNSNHAKPILQVVE